MSDPLPSIWHLGLIFILVVLNGFFVSAEYALVKIRGGRIDTLVEEGRRNASAARSIINQLDGYLSACQLGITLASLGLGWVGQPIVASFLQPLFDNFGWKQGWTYGVSFTLAFLFIAVLHIVLGELAPKTIAVRMADEVTLLSAKPMKVFYKVMYPLIWIVNGLANRLLSLLRVRPASEQDYLHTEEEIRIMMKESSESGLIDSAEMKLVDNIFDFAATTAREIMIPRTEMICLYMNNSLQENIDISIGGMRTRYPLCDTDKDNIIGFIHIKDMLRSDCNDLRELLRPILAVPESISISDLMKRMQKSKTQIAILIDEYGGTSGLVTLEDIMEQIVGEIQDEFDEERPAIEQIEEDVYSIDGLMLIESVNERFHLGMDSEDYDTIGGWLYARIDALPPKIGQTAEFDGYLFTIEETDDKRISRVRLLKQQFLPLEEAGA
ncbi:hemolysin family protein [Paenibacillus pinistramenti]|uniref:hemolysin family protein n=1 Tax=Paenibacillus pinistramenti TaxID=1768003 RepID=UPI001108A20B|nr:hemolysin family protein [Paenibacillus pinistramenti]